MLSDTDRYCICAWREPPLDVTMSNRLYSGKNKNNKVNWQFNVGLTVSVLNRLQPNYRSC